MVMAAPPQPSQTHLTYERSNGILHGVSTIKRGGYVKEVRLRQALRAFTSFVLALARYGRCTLNPAQPPGIDWQRPGNPVVVR
jgi:hypothetical protein